MGWSGKAAAFLAVELVLLVTPMMWPTIPISIGIVFYAVAAALFIYAAWPLLTSRSWWRSAWLFIRYPTLRISFSDWLGVNSRKEMARSVGDRVIWTEPEYRITGFDFSARNSSGTRLSNISGQVQSLETGESFPIFIDAMPPEQTYGIPAKAPFRINVRFPRSTPELEGWTIEDFWRHMGAFSLTVTDGEAMIFHAKIGEKEVRQTLEQRIEAAKFPAHVGHRVERRQ